MYDFIMQTFPLSSETTILDVGVGNDDRKDSNFFEKLYPYPSKITAVGVEEAPGLQIQYPGLKYYKIDGTQLPFSDKSFDLVVSFATLEHVGNRERQKQFVHEICRVGRSCCITTPNRWYPVEFHTILPFVHWLPAKYFRIICKVLRKDFFAQEENLNLVSRNIGRHFFPTSQKIRMKDFRLFGLVSNLMFYRCDESSLEREDGQ